MSWINPEEQPASEVVVSLGSWQVWLLTQRMMLHSKWALLVSTAVPLYKVISVDIVLSAVDSDKVLVVLWSPLMSYALMWCLYWFWLCSCLWLCSKYIVWMLIFDVISFNPQVFLMWERAVSSTVWRGSLHAMSVSREASQSEWHKHSNLSSECSCSIFSRIYITVHMLQNCSSCTKL